MPNLEIIVLTYRRTAWLERGLKSLDEAASRAQVRLRTIVVVNGRDAATSALLNESGNDLRSLDLDVVESLERQPCGFARNAAIERTSAEWIYFADDDAWVEPNFFSTFFAYLDRHPKAAVIGGPNVTHESMSTFQKVAGHVLGSRLAAGPFSRRYRGGGKVTLEEDDRALILCNLFVKRGVLDDYRFPQEMSCAEENHMLHVLDARSAVKVFHPGLAVAHERASGWLRFASSAIRYGRGRGELISLDGWAVKSSRLVIAGSIVALVSFASIPSTAAALYAAALIVQAITIGMETKSPAALFWSPLLTITLHALYPVGVAMGIFQTPLRSMRSMSAPILAWSEARPRALRARSDD